MQKLPDRVLETERLLLEPLVASHAALLHEPLLDESIYRFIPDVPPTSVKALEIRYGLLERRFSSDEKEAWLNWAVRLRESADYAGTMQATVYPDETAEIAYVFFPRFWKKGYAREASRRVVEHLFGEWPVRTVAAVMDTRNLASQRLAEALGFRRVSETREAGYFRGAYSHEYRYELARQGK
ncbi:GNAT family N-acetyltransferase [bacterium]|nr:GNAT family N-acetyltransferase [bacterium]